MKGLQKENLVGECFICPILDVPKQVFGDGRAWWEQAQLTWGLENMAPVEVNDYGQFDQITISKGIQYLPRDCVPFCHFIDHWLVHAYWRDALH